MRYLVGLSLFTLLSGSVLSAQQRPTSSYGKAPLAFERNAGQTATQVKYLSRGKGYSLFLTPNEATFALQKNTPPQTPSFHTKRKGTKETPESTQGQW